MNYSLLKQNKFQIISFIAFIISILLIIISAKAQTLQTVTSVDLNKYAGKWYEIASYPQSFQKGCYATTAEYTPTKADYIIVENKCNKGSLKGKQSYIKGKAFVQKNSGNAKLKVQFFWPFKGDYWIIDLADDYSYAVISHPNKQYLWILSRTPKMNNNTYEQILNRLQKAGFNLNKLKITPQI